MLSMGNYFTIKKNIFIVECVYWSGNESLLSQLYQGRIVMPRPVYAYFWYMILATELGDARE